MEFKVLLKKARQDAKLTRTQLAEDSGLRVESIMRYEQGEYVPTYHSLRGLAKALGVSGNYLLGLDD